VRGFGQSVVDAYWTSTTESESRSFRHFRINYGGESH
jgi:hypothetical protein